MIQELKKDIEKLADPVRAGHSARFFKTGPGQYGEGDKFVGLKVPEQRILAKKYRNLQLPDLKKLINSSVHEQRLTAVFILVDRYKKSKNKQLEVEFYLENLAGINNWDLVDSSAHKILGDFLLDKDRDILYRLAKSNNLWQKRIAMISTFAFIPKKDFKDALKIAEILLHDDHDLIHKAVGWTLREVGNRDRAAEEEFLKKHYKSMPRTALRYAIEKFPEELRQKYLKGEA
ncbi:DNA alkylation repair protein [Patescibacteria group bacterium]|nr:DNA alkylation repair protein [Patescibacteria group bacterium]